MVYVLICIVECMVSSKRRSISATCSLSAWAWGSFAVRSREVISDCFTILQFVPLALIIVNPFVWTRYVTTFIVVGSVGFAASSLFVRKIYSSIKIDWWPSVTPLRSAIRHVVGLVSPILIWQDNSLSALLFSISRSLFPHKHSVCTSTSLSADAMIPARTIILDFCLCECNMNDPVHFSAF